MGCGISSDNQSGQVDMGKLNLKQLKDLPTGDLNTRELDERNYRIFAFENGLLWSDYLQANGLASPIVGKFIGLVPWPGKKPYKVEIEINEARFKDGVVKYPGLQASGTLTFTGVNEEKILCGCNSDENGALCYDEYVPNWPVGKVSLKLLDSGDVKYAYGDIADGMTAILKKM
jgi:hypothetical protein